MKFIRYRIIPILKTHILDLSFYRDCGFPFNNELLNKIIIMNKIFNYSYFEFNLTWLSQSSTNYPKHHGRDKGVNIALDGSTYPC